MKKIALSIIVAALLVICTTITANAMPNQATDDQRYYLGSTVNTGWDTGYSQSNLIDTQDPHFGWQLGSFYIDGYSGAVIDDPDTPVFLKNVGDEVTLRFRLDQDINALNNKKELSISGDSNGHDDYFGIGISDFGKGTLIIRQTDYKNETGNPVIYTNYLSALTTGAETKVKLCEEGDYEAALNYEIQQAPVRLFNEAILPAYFNYSIRFRFSVRNGNCMVYPFDSTTGAELSNASFTENGFYLDLAKSRYLDINVKKEVLKDGADGLVEDIRFNRVDRDGEMYTDEGIYTVTVGNRYTGSETTKKIYVGENDILKAHLVTGMEIGEIKTLLLNGAQIRKDGTIAPPEFKHTNASKEPSTLFLSAETEAPIEEDLTSDIEEKQIKYQGFEKLLAAAIVIIMIFAGFRKNRSTEIKGENK